MHCRDAHVINRCLRLVWPFVEKQSYFLFFVFYFIFCHETEVPVYCLGISTLLSLSFGFRPNFALENHQVSILFVLTGEMFLTNELELSHITDLGVTFVQSHNLCKKRCMTMLNDESGAWDFIRGTKKPNTLFPKIC